MRVRISTGSLRNGEGLEHVVSGFAAPAAAVDEPSPDEAEEVDSRPMDRVLISSVYLAAMKLSQHVRVHLTGTEPCGKGKLTDTSTL